MLLISRSNSSTAENIRRSKVPRIFLKRALRGCVDVAKKEGITLITPEFMDTIRDKRAMEKQEA